MLTKANPGESYREEEKKQPKPPMLIKLRKLEKTPSETMLVGEDRSSVYEKKLRKERKWAQGSKQSEPKLIEPHWKQENLQPLPKDLEEKVAEGIRKAKQQYEEAALLPAKGWAKKRAELEREVAREKAKAKVEVEQVRLPPHLQEELGVKEVPSYKPDIHELKGFMFSLAASSAAFAQGTMEGVAAALLPHKTIESTLKFLEKPAENLKRMGEAIAANPLEASRITGQVVGSYLAFRAVGKGISKLIPKKTRTYEIVPERTKGYLTFEEKGDISKVVLKEFHSGKLVRSKLPSPTGGMEAESLIVKSGITPKGFAIGKTGFSGSKGTYSVVSQFVASETGATLLRRSIIDVAGKKIGLLDYLKSKVLGKPPNISLKDVLFGSRKYFGVEERAIITNEPLLRDLLRKQVSVFKVEAEPSGVTVAKSRTLVSLGIPKLAEKMTGKPAGKVMLTRSGLGLEVKAASALEKLATQVPKPKTITVMEPVHTAPKLTPLSILAPLTTTKKTTQTPQVPEATGKQPKIPTPTLEPTSLLTDIDALKQFRISNIISYKQSAAPRGKATPRFTFKLDIKPLKLHRSRLLLKELNKLRKHYERAIKNVGKPSAKKKQKQPPMLSLKVEPILKLETPPIQDLTKIPQTRAPTETITTLKTPTIQTPKTPPILQLTPPKLETPIIPPLEPLKPPRKPKTPLYPYSLEPSRKRSLYAAGTKWWKRIWSGRFLFNKNKRKR